MAVYNPSGLTISNNTIGVKYTKVTDSSIDWSGVTGNTYFFDVATQLPYYKSGDNIVYDIFTGTTNFINGLTATTISATTYQNLPTDIRVTGVTYSNNTFTFTNNTGGTFNTLFNTLTGLTVNGNLSVTGNTSVRGLTGTTATISGTGQNILTVVGSGDTSPLLSVQGSSGNIFTISDSSTGSIFTVNDVSNNPILQVLRTNSVLISGSLTATTISATTYLNLPTDITVTGATYSNNTFTYTNNTGGTFNVLFNTVTGLTVNGNLNVTGNTTLSSLTATTISATTISGGTLYGDGSNITNIANKLIAMTELTASTLVTHTIGTTNFTAFNLNSDGTNRLAKITFTAPPSGKVSIEMLFDMLISNSAAVQMIGLNTTTGATSTPSEGWYRINADNDATSGQFYAQFVKTNLTPGNSYTYYFMGVCDFSGNQVRISSIQTGAYSAGSDRPAPLRIMVYDLDNVTITTNPSS